MTEKKRQCLDCQTPLTEEYYNALRCWTCSRKRTDRLRRIGELRKLNLKANERIVILQEKIESRNRDIDKLEEELGVSG